MVRSIPRKALVVSLFLLAGAWLYGVLFLEKGQEEVRILIPEGVKASQVVDLLEEKGVLVHPVLMYALLRTSGLDRRIRAGGYVFTRPAPLAEIVLNLAFRPRGVYLVRVTVPEGANLRRIARIVEDSLLIPADTFLARARDPHLIQSLHRKFPEIPDTLPHLEGYLYPETYHFALGVGAREVIETMVEELLKRWKVYKPRADSMGWSLHQVLTLASIVEKEAIWEDEKPVIAGVFHNRLRRGMPLAADPTVKYILPTGKRPSFEDVEVLSPYNTYRHPGLPPTPIASPSESSIRAVLYPADVPYLYFVAAPGGRHFFARTFREHLRYKSLSKKLLGW